MRGPWYFTNTSSFFSYQIGETSDSEEDEGSFSWEAEDSMEDIKPTVKHKRKLSDDEGYSDDDDDNESGDDDDDDDDEMEAESDDNDDDEENESDEEDGFKNPKEGS